MGMRLWAEMTREEIAATVGEAVLVLPTGATEQHGPHLPTGHDTLSVTEVALRAGDAATAPVIVLPTLPFGSSAHHLPFGGTLSLATETYYAVVRQVAESSVFAGGRTLLILNGHGGNHELNQLVARDVVLDRQARGHHITIAAGSYWEIARAAITALPDMANVRLPGHAGQFETATMLAWRSELVRTPIAPRDADPAVDFPVAGLRHETGFAWQAFDGYTDLPHRATAALGERLLAAITREVANAIDALAATAT